MRHLRFLLALFAALFVPTLSSNHAEAQTAVYAGFSGAAVSGTGAGSAYGALAGLYSQAGHYGYFGGDFRATYLTRNGFNYYSGAVGPRLAFKPPILPFRPYIEGLVGAANYNNGKGTSSSTHLNYQVVAGFDATILPRIDWRVIEYDFNAATGGVHTNIFTTGLVLRIW
jgi:hypothetical protein